MEACSRPNNWISRDLVGDAFVQINAEVRWRFCKISVSPSAPNKLICEINMPVSKRKKDGKVPTKYELCEVPMSEISDFRKADDYAFEERVYYQEVDRLQSGFRSG